MYGMNSTAPDASQVYELVNQLKLQKALATGDDQRFNGGVGSAYPLKPELLDKTLISTSFTMDDIQLFKLISKNPVTNSITQHNELISYGQYDNSGFFAEGGAPPQDSAEFIRRVNRIRYIGVAGGVTHQLSLQQLATVDADALTLETQLRTMSLLQKIETALYHGDSSCSDLQYDGLFAQIRDKSPKENTIDLHGAPLTEDILINGATYIRSAPNYGKIDHLLCSILTKGDIQRGFGPRVRIDGFNANDGVLRTEIKAIETPAGSVDLVGTTMMKPMGRMPTASGGPALAIPGQPTVGAASTPTIATSNYRDSDAGSYLFAVVACNDNGHSAPVMVGSGAIAVSAGQAVQFTVTPAPGNTTKWYDVYKTTPNGGAASLERVARVPNCDPTTKVASTVTATITEFNETMPGTEVALGLQMQPDALRLDVLASMLRLAQPVVGTTLPFLLLSYHAPILLAPKRILKFVNIGRLPRQPLLA